jgi:copper chaperone CopZ
VEKALGGVEGFKKMTADVAKQEVQVEYDPAKTDPEKLAKAITDGTDFNASVKT